MTKLIIIFGPQAVGKMTVGRELARQCGFDFLMNHDTIDLLLPLFDWNEPAFGRLNNLFREEIMREYGHSGKNGLVFSFGWGLDYEDDYKAIERYRSYFESHGGSVWFIELESTLEERLKRNRTELRLEAKPFKRNIEHSEKLVLDWEQYKMNSSDDFIYRNENYIKIDNTHLSPEAVVALIRERFGWKEIV